MRFTWILYCSRGSGASYENSSLVDVGSIISPRVGGGEIRRQFKDDLKDRFKMKDFRKTDYRDAYILWKVYETAIAKGNLRNWFKLITIIDVELKPILMLENDVWSMA